MKIVQINTFSNKSTGTLMMNIHKKLLEEGYDSYVVWGRGRKSQNDHEIYLNDKMGIYYHGLYTRLTDKTGFASKNATKRLIKKLDEIKPDVVHLHNLHGYYINIELLFNYLKKSKTRVIWTLHDCWAFTGHCPHFELINCDKWMTGCYSCPQKEVYPKSIKDNSKWNYQKKKELFDGLNLTIITPCEWLANLVKKSFLKNYKVKVIYNGIDTNIFKPTSSDFRKRYNLENKKIILGVTSDWTKEKGLYDFFELSKTLDGDKQQIVLVGLNDAQMKELPQNIIGIKRTENQRQLAEIYSVSDVYFNPTYADNFPTTNLEALACGTPVITYDTGGSPECINNGNGETITKKMEMHDLKRKIEKIISYKRDESLLNNQFVQKNMISNYIKEYKMEGTK